MNLNIYSPVEQFAIICYLRFNLGLFDFSWTNSSLYLSIIALLLFLFSSILFIKGGLFVPSRWQLILEGVYEFITGLIDQQIGLEGKPYFFLIFAVFLTILLANLIGMVPYGFTTTSHLAVTVGFSLSLLIGITIMGFQKHGLHFLSFFLPKGVPLALGSLLVLIEIVSYLSRPISLGVRLFANMMAGHILLHILSGFAYASFCAGGVLMLAGIFPFLAVIAVTLLEFLVACLQAYVLTTLIAIYMHDSIALH